MSDTLPEMSRQEASWHQHLAGMRAAEKARSQGSDLAATTALATATAGPVEIGGFLLEPATQGTIWTLQRVAREFKAWADRIGMPAQPADSGAPGTRELFELGLATLVFCDSKQCWNDLDSGLLETLILRAEDMMWKTPLPIQVRLQQHFHKQMDQVKGLSGDSEEDAPGKPPQEAPNGESPAPPTQPVVADSLPSNGSPPNTTSPSPIVFGACP